MHLEIFVSPKDGHIKNYSPKQKKPKSDTFAKSKITWRTSFCIIEYLFFAEHLIFSSLILFLSYSENEAIHCTFTKRITDLPNFYSSFEMLPNA